MISCPLCGTRRAIGKVGAEQYFCCDCYVEFIINDGVAEVFSLQPDGTLTAYASEGDGGEGW